MCIRDSPLSLLVSIPPTGCWRPGEPCYQPTLCCYVMCSTELACYTTMRCVYCCVVLCGVRYCASVCCYVVCSTNQPYPAPCCAVLTSPILRRGVQYQPNPSCYGVCGTEPAYGAMRCA
eukprot:3370472-Rhodomonas_salina.1